MSVLHYILFSLYIFFITDYFVFWTKKNIRTNEFTESAKVLVCDVYVSSRIIPSAASENFPRLVILALVALVLSALACSCNLKRSFIFCSESNEYS